VSDIAWKIEVLLKTVAYCGEQVVRSLERVMTIYDDTSHILTTVL
jgi:hypothetical protein